VTDDYTVHSVTVSEVMNSDGERCIAVTHEGDPSVWDVLGLLGWAMTATRAAVIEDQDVEQGE